MTNTYGSINDANFAALTEAVSGASSSASSGLSGLTTQVKTEGEALVSALNNMTTQLIALTDAVDALNKED